MQNGASWEGEPRHPGKENIPTLVTPWSFFKETEHGFWMSRFQPRLLPLKHLSGLEACNPCITQTDVRSFSSQVFRVPECKSLNDVQAIIYLKLPEKIFRFLLPAHHRKFKKQLWQSLPRIPAKCSLLWGKEAMQSTEGNVVKPERKQKLSNSALISRYVNDIPLFRPPFSLVRYYTTRKFIIVI